MLRANGLIDMIIPRAGRRCTSLPSSMPPFRLLPAHWHLHVYVDAAADLTKVIPSCQRQGPAPFCLQLYGYAAGPPGCSAPDFTRWPMPCRKNVELRCEPRALAMLEDHRAVRPAGPDDFDTEFMALIAAIKVVDNLDEAIDHIYTHGSSHSEAIITEDYTAAMRFVNEVNSAAVLLTPVPALTTAASLAWAPRSLSAPNPPRPRSHGPEGADHLQVGGAGNGQIRP